MCYAVRPDRYHLTSFHRLILRSLNVSGHLESDREPFQQQRRFLWVLTPPLDGCSFSFSFMFQCRYAPCMIIKESQEANSCCYSSYAVFKSGVSMAAGVLSHDRNEGRLEITQRLCYLCGSMFLSMYVGRIVWPYVIRPKMIFLVGGVKGKVRVKRDADAFNVRDSAIPVFIFRCKQV